MKTSNLGRAHDISRELKALDNMIEQIDSKIKTGSAFIRNDGNWTYNLELTEPVLSQVMTLIKTDLIDKKNILLNEAESL